MYFSTPPSPKVENFQMKIYYPAGDRTPDPLNQRQTCYHLSQRAELFYISKNLSPSIKFLSYLCPKCLETRNANKQNTWDCAVILYCYCPHLHETTSLCFCHDNGWCSQSEVFHQIHKRLPLKQNFSSDAILALGETEFCWILKFPYCQNIVIFLLRSLDLENSMSGSPGDVSEEPMM